MRRWHATEFSLGLVRFRLKVPNFNVSNLLNRKNSLFPTPILSWEFSYGVYLPSVMKQSRGITFKTKIFLASKVEGQSVAEVRDHSQV